MQKNGAELAIEEVNASGALGKFKIVPIHQDDAGDRGQTVNIFQRLLFQEKVKIIFGPTLANSAFAADPIAQNAKVPVIASSNTAPGITAMGDYIFRTSAPELMVFPGVLDYAVKRYGAEDGGADLRHRRHADEDGLRRATKQRWTRPASRSWRTRRSRRATSIIPHS